MTDKTDAKVFEVYQKMKLEVHKYEDFAPRDIPRLTILGMKLLQKLKGLSGPTKKEKLVSMIKLLIRESGHDSFEPYDSDLLHYLIDDLYEGGILVKRWCC